MPALIPLDGLLGATLVGILLSSVIYGVTLLQVYVYYGENSKNDPPFLKRFVAMLMTLDTVHLALLCHAIYIYTVTNFGDYFALEIVLWSLSVQVVVGDLVTSCVQFFFAFRIYHLSLNTNRWLPVVICSLSVAALVTGVGFTVEAMHLHQFENTGKNVPWCASGLSIELACDVAITTSMVYYLLKARTEFSGNNRAMTKLVTYSLNTGFLTTVFTSATLIAFLLADEQLIYAPFFFILIRLYSVAFMSTLNLRKNVRAAMETGPSNIFSLSAFRANASMAADDDQAGSDNDKDDSGNALGGDQDLPVSKAVFHNTVADAV